LPFTSFKTSQDRLAARGRHHQKIATCGRQIPPRGHLHPAREAGFEHEVIDIAVAKL
jgi:hypothetical protein